MGVLFRGKLQGFGFGGRGFRKPADFRIGRRQRIQHVGPPTDWSACAYLCLSPRILKRKLNRMI